MKRSSLNLLFVPMVVVIVMGMLPSAGAFAQEENPTDTTRIAPSDSIIITRRGKVMTIESYAARYNPRKAMLFSAALPGLGQAYNGKYWKIPLVYGGIGGFAYGVWWNQNNYIDLREGLFGLLNEPDNPTVNAEGFTKFGNIVINGEVLFPYKGNNVREQVLRNAVNRYRRDRDFMLIASFLFYMLQMVDAHVDAHLKEFDLNPQLQVSIEPAVNQNAFIGRSFGAGIVLKF